MIKVLTGIGSILGFVFIIGLIILGMKEIVELLDRVFNKLFKP